MAAVAVSASVFAQTTESAQRTAIVPNSAGDNIYLGVNWGVSTPLKGYRVMGNLTPELGLRLVKNFGTVFGIGVDANMHFASTPTSYELYGKTYKLDTKTFVDNTDISLIGTANLSNLFGGYKGEPRCFEVLGLGGFGWGHRYGNLELDALTSKIGLDFAVNLGKEKAVQVYAEPSITWDILGSEEVLNTLDYHNDRAHFSFKIGLNYKFKNSNGKHNFTIEQLRDQAEVDALTTEAQTLYKNYQNEVVFLSKEQKKAKQDAIVAKEKEAADLKKKYFGPEGELYKKRTALMTPIQEEVYNAIKDVADLRGYQLVLDRASDTGIIYGSPKIDISSEVLGKLGYSK